MCPSCKCHRSDRDREFFLENLLVRIHFIIVMIRWTGLAPWEFESLFRQVVQSDRKALVWLRRAAKQGVPEAAV